MANVLGHVHPPGLRGGVTGGAGGVDVEYGSIGAPLAQLETRAASGTRWREYGLAGMIEAGEGI